MLVSRLAVVQWRCYADVVFEPAPGLTVVHGDNGQGKTNLLEAIAWLATLESFRGAPTEALVRDGADTAMLRGELDDGGRVSTIEATLPRKGSSRVLVNRQRLTRARDVLGTLRVTVFTPDDLSLTKGGPGERRRYLDDLAVALRPGLDKVRGDLDRVLRQRATLLKQAGGRLTDEVATTLDVWDAQLADLGTRLGEARRDLATALQPLVERAYAKLAAAHHDVTVVYDPPWLASGLAVALAASRHDDVRRGVNGVGPHRDELDVGLAGLPARTHASQGEQRTLALALRLAGHELVTDRTGSPPVLLLDDVFSELDPHRSEALLAHLPPGQAVLTTAGPLPTAVHPDLVVRVEHGALVP